MRLFKRLRRKLYYLSDQQIAQIYEAFLTALEAHRDQVRQTGEPYITHPVSVACILADMKMDASTIMAALLHDVIEDTGIGKIELENQFGKEVADLVDGVSKLTQIEFVSRQEAQAENFRKMVLAMARDIRVIIVKLADRLHNMRTLGGLSEEKKYRVSKETLEIFAPIARRLGMRDFSVELEEIAFSLQYPKRYAVLKDSVQKARGNRKKILALINKTLQDGLTQHQFPSCTILGREKHLYSIYRKMRAKKIPFNEIMDVYAFRIIVDDVDTCYRVLGLVHHLFKPVPERFKDYIAIPKANGYQSLHTTLFGPYGLPIEIQIRTSEMDRIASSGIAAHWLYKSDEKDLEKTHIQAQKWVNNLLELQKNAGSSLEFIESVKVDLFPDEVYIFTPKGDIKGLPAGATGVDFAYEVHTDIGNSCMAIKINRQLAPLSARLSNGDTVEIVTASTARPNPSWLDFVITSKARNGIRQFLKSQRQTASATLGKKLLQKALRDHSLAMKKIPDSVWEFYLKETQLKNKDTLLCDIGLGNRAAPVVAERIDAIMQAHGDKASAFEAFLEEMPLLVEGTEGMLLEFAQCCYPIPGDPIVGILKTGKGILVHTDYCREISSTTRQSTDFVPLRWSDQVAGEFVVAISVAVKNERGVLAQLASVIAELQANIDDVEVSEREINFYQVQFRIFVKNRLHLAQIMKALRQIPSVLKITRLIS
ncbi:MAG: bifunctional GTP diphosphokinase/guanosine-3',5'-bis(diphosphate) 3'-diphosphatase [Gammaproteobacteria bacterium RIFCSPLOWO2_02_FULL_42_14]|nr:MAG: bifunctional GTP diphosphokinase/guanosine-3',5'-bis(diphosphate) 3'-diphosphatase [Gammaproteobacteria bacterium RIFCSPHIGHO2_02_FULL_42_43]OGT52131.1 MAG: bifunctional GTP diphosphokinase/guanosine-3',5'-bis(diphosphate) 3'-diphosphatase [Gammaproteobacteria bacterium RIFCSPHIGHO2_12_FULL_41_25]OGT62568.1 MAG: bifunctional GTP diphosphokinase/guanosine-3',5'-bis(diphosphate) 3'-diphosphatase [Gammaproteobacteria bacterium RIFCSPLOWO2_02_FULL_42_14]OGT86551.1 MAG: bifunctional GTP dipho